MAFAIMRVEKIKSVSAGSSRLKHNRRETPCKTLQHPERKNFHFIFTEEQKADSQKNFKQIFDEHTGNQNIRKNAVHALEFVLTYSPHGIDKMQASKWVQDSVAWVAENFGGQKNIIDCQLHVDETTPHLHVMVIPIDEHGKLNARSFLGGTRERMSELQSSYAEKMKPFKLERGISKKITKAKHKDYKKHIAEQADRENRLKAYERLFGDEKNFDLDTRLSFEKAKIEVSESLSEPAPFIEKNER